MPQLLYLCPALKFVIIDRSYEQGCIARGTHGVTHPDAAMTTVQGSHSASAERTLCSQLSEVAAALDAGAELDHNTAWIDVLRGMCFENTHKYVDVKPQARHIRDVPVATLTTVLRYLCDVPSERGVDP